MFYVYLLQSKFNYQYYVGSTKDLKRRFKQHNEGKQFSTKRYIPWKLIYYEAFQAEHLARMREKKLKQHGNALRELKKRLEVENGDMALPSTGLRGAGFTLVELIIVISILGILAVIAIMIFNNQKLKGLDARRKSDMNRIKIAVEEYEKDHNCYPQPDLVLCDMPVESPGTGLVPYLNKIPCDPTTHKSYPYEIDGSLVCAKWYRIYTYIENSADDQIISGIGPNSAYNFVMSSSNAPLVVGSSSTPAPTVAPTAIPGGGNNGTNYYGCINGSCVQLGGNVCSPNFDNANCNGNICPQDPGDSLECK